MKKLLKPKCQFNIYFNRRTSPEFVTILVHPTYKALQAQRQNLTTSCEAFFRTTHISEIIKVQKGTEERTVNHCFGHVHFHPGSLNVEIISHEIYHVVTAWAWEHGCLPRGNESPATAATYDHEEPPTNEELCAELLGVLTAQTMIGLKKHLGRKFLVAEMLL